MKYIAVFGIFLAVITSSFETSARTLCRDGSTSGSSGSGTCSHHGGEAR
jgi:hypothetical protein